MSKVRMTNRRDHACGNSSKRYKVLFLNTTTESIMNLDESEKENEAAKPPKKLSRKEKKAKRRAEKEAALKAEQESQKEIQESVPDESSSEIEAELEPSPVPDIPPVQYNAWEKISPPAKRKKQLATMESGYREVLALVHSMRENQEVLMHSFQKLPEAVDSVKKLADHSARQSDLLSAMNEQLDSGSPGKFNDTLTSMDKTTQLLLERAQRSEERLYSMLRRAQRRIAFMTLLVLLLFLGTAGAILFLAFPDQTQGWLEERGWRTEEAAPLQNSEEQQVIPDTTDSEDSTDSEPLTEESDAIESSVDAATEIPAPSPKVDDDQQEPILDDDEELPPEPVSPANEIEEAPVQPEVPPLPPPPPMNPQPTMDDMDAEQDDNQE